MEGFQVTQELETASVVKVPREPAIIINGVPDLPPDCASGSKPVVRDAAESQLDPHFGEWLEGRKVRKLFGDKHYVGKVVKYDSEGNWYNVVYEDGDQEDLEWHELEEVLLPLDITVSLKTLVMDECKLQNTGPGYRPKVGRPRKVYALMEYNMSQSSDVVPVSEGINVMSNQMMVKVTTDQQSNNVPGLLPASTSDDAMNVSASARKDAQLCLSASNQPRKRGRPRKDRTTSVDNQPKRRGRPPKNRSKSGNPQGADSTSNSLALVPVQDGSASTEKQEAYKRQNSVHKRNAQTVKAERLKREALRLQGAQSGTRLF